MALSEERLRSIIESLLLISPDPIQTTRIIEVIRIEDHQTDEIDVKDAIKSLIKIYQDPDRAIAKGFRVEEIGGGLQLRTVPENAQYVRRFLSAKPQRLSKASLETLAIVAYRQPVTKPEIESIRGVDAGAALKGLLERDLLKILGKKDEIGRPIIYGTTKTFLEFFGLKSLAELPTLREFHELDMASQQTLETEAIEHGVTLSELTNVAQFLVEREHDTDLDALDAALKAADVAKTAAESVLQGQTPETPATAKEETPSDKEDKPKEADENTKEEISTDDQDKSSLPTDEETTDEETLNSVAESASDVETEVDSQHSKDAQVDTLDRAQYF